MYTTEIVELIKYLQGKKIGDKDALPEIDSRFKVELDSLCTADTLNIFIVNGDDKLLVFYKTNWCSSRYEFNEKGKSIGFQCSGPWVEYLTCYFEKCRNAREEYLCYQKSVETKNESAKREDYQYKVKRFASMFSDEAPDA